MLKQLLISGVLLVSAVPPALAGPTGFWGTSQVPNVPCNIWGCPNAPLGAECTIRGCPPSPQVAAPIPQYPQYPQYPYPQQPVPIAAPYPYPYPYGQPQQQQSQQPFDPEKFQVCVRQLTYDKPDVFGYSRRTSMPQERAEQLCLGKG